ncbi:hypothetical protein J2S78_001688 [Salibacterium salarium]|uniref:hypothetical protein n=1 Tax=Salibacterium salarium TaxID=284579 RepID=UPI002782B015|nr:hypothetical protein [Salibacterium salarium]MDQ0299268.1 hypothetical protein [Salibacterium salarium]
MERIQKEQRLHSLQKIEKAIGNAEKALQSPDKQSISQPLQSLIQAKQTLNMAWDYHLKQHI